MCVCSDFLDCGTDLFRLAPEGKRSQYDSIVHAIVPVSFPATPQNLHACERRQIDQSSGRFVEQPAVHHSSEPASTDLVETCYQYH